MDVLDRNIAAYITNCLLGVADETLNMMLRDSQPRSESGLLKIIHQAVQSDPGDPRAMEWARSAALGIIVHRDPQLHGIYESAIKADSLKAENEKLKERLRAQTEDYVSTLKEIEKDLQKVEKLLFQKEPERRAVFYRQEGLVFFKTFKNGEFRKLIVTEGELVPYVIEGLKERYPGIQIEEV